MISLSPITTSTDTAIINEFANYDRINSEARASKTKLLDGTTAHTHSGVSVGDEELTVKARVTQVELEIIERLYRNHTDLTIATSTGLFSGYIFRMRASGDVLNMTIYKKSRLDV